MKTEFARAILSSALTLCSAFVSAEEALVLSVLPFKTQAEPAYAFIGESFSETLATKLVGVRGIKLYERSQFARVADELKLEASSADFFDKDTVSRVGKVVSIDYLLLGSTTLAGSVLSCEVRLVNVNSGRAVLSQEFRGNYPKDLFDMQDKAALLVAKTLELRLSDLDLRSLARKPTTDVDAFGLYNSCLASKDDKQRIALLEKAVARDPGFSQALNLLADLYEEAGRANDARATYAKVLAADPQDYRATYNQALLELDAGTPTEAAALLSRCLELKGEDPDALYHLGLASEYGESGKRFGPGCDLTAARGYYERAKSADPQHRESLYALGVVCASLAQSSTEPREQLRLIDESLGSLRSYIALAPDCPSRDEIESNLQLLEGSKKSLVEYVGEKEGAGSH